MMLVRFSVDGFGPLDAQPDVYVDYVAPGGRVRQTVDLGMARGVCGHLAPTSPRRLFRFRAGPGMDPAVRHAKRYKKGRIDPPGFLFSTRR